MAARTSIRSSASLEPKADPTPSDDYREWLCSTPFSDPFAKLAQMPRHRRAAQRLAEALGRDAARSGRAWRPTAPSFIQPPLA